MSTIFFDLEQLYQRTFGTKPWVPSGDDGPEPVTNPYQMPASTRQNEKPSPYNIKVTNKQVSQLSGSTLVEQYKGKEIWLPTRFRGINIDKRTEFYLPFCVVKISGKKTIVKTAMSERQGTVKELYSTDDYSISLKGFFIDVDNRVWPEEDLTIFKKIFELQSAFVLENALTNVFLAKDQIVVIESFDITEVEGGRKHIRPFNIQLESDSIFTLEV
jgi:hypothetical protein